MAYPHEPDPVSRDDRDLDDTSRGRSPWGDSALAALDQYRRIVDQQPTPIFEALADLSHGGVESATDAMPPAVSAEVGGYTYADPVTDADWPRITEAGDEPVDAFPDGWATEPTHRDQAAIDAGNA